MVFVRFMQIGPVILSCNFFFLKYVRLSETRVRMHDDFTLCTEQVS